MPSGRASGLVKDWQEAKMAWGPENLSLLWRLSKRVSWQLPIYHAIFFMYFVCVCASLYHDSYMYLGMVLCL